MTLTYQILMEGENKSPKPIKKHKPSSMLKTFFTCSLLLVTFLTTFAQQCDPGYTGENCQYSMCGQQFEQYLFPEERYLHYAGWTPMTTLAITPEKLFWNPTVLLIRVEITRIVNPEPGATTLFQLLVDGDIVAQAHVVHRNEKDEQSVTFFAVATVDRENNHDILLEGLTTAGTTTIVGSETSSIRMFVFFFPESNIRYKKYTDIPEPKESPEFTEEPLNMQFEFELPEGYTTYAIAGITRIQQDEPANSVYALALDGVPFAKTNTGDDHREFMRRHIAIGSAIDKSEPGGHVLSVQFKTAEGHPDSWYGDDITGMHERYLIAFNMPTPHIYFAEHLEDHMTETPYEWKDIGPFLDLTISPGTAGYLYVSAEITKIQASGPGHGFCYFRILVGETQVAETSVYYDARDEFPFYKFVSFSGAIENPGSVGVRLQMRADEGIQVIFSSDGNGEHYRRLTAFFFPLPISEDGLTCCGDLYQDNRCDMPLCFGSPNGCGPHGDCIAPNFCKCHQGWTGSRCQYPTCMDIPATNPNVCNGHGTCTDVDTCVCQSGWSGQFCQTQTSCFGKPFDDPNVCSGHGQCIGLDTCQCQDGWTGPECEQSTTTCFGIPSNDPNVCSGNGNCVQQDKCQCQPLWTGQTCNVAVSCYGIPFNNPSVCSGKGQCVGPNTCQCQDGWTGPECELSTTTCFGIPSNDPNVCSGHGVCVQQDTCQCQPLWTGQSCNVAVTCFGIPFNNPSVCSGHGTCVQKDVCDCNNGFSGTDCSIPTCFGLSAIDPNVCSGHGNCVAPDTCACEAQWSGSNCQLATTCFGIPFYDPSVCTGHGQCVANDQCQCNPGYYGQQCGTKTTCFGTPFDNPNVCSGNGQCTQSDTCECNSGYSGERCELPVCFGKPGDDPNVCSGHGQCTHPDTCSCDNGWNGTLCDTATTCFGIPFYDPNVCSGHGQCTQPNTCECDSGYSGERCDKPTCMGKPPDDPNVCSGNGACVAPDTCVCNAGWTGSNCDVAVSCFGIPSYEPSVCNGHGVCTGQDECDCNNGYTGQNCSIPICYSLPANDPNVCSGSGKCVDANVCSCDPGYSGDNCQIAITCFGLPFYHVDVCSRNGKCVAENVCNCNLGYSGENCETQMKCFGVPFDYPNVCSGRGQCVEQDTCSCDAGWSGNNCQFTGCFGKQSDDPLVCSGHGNCVAPDTCDCIAEYTGQTCSIPICYGYAGDDQNVCSAHGVCTAPNACECMNGWTGMLCNVSTCYGIPEYEPHVCSGHGICTAPNNCSCFPAFSGAECEIDECPVEVSLSARFTLDATKIRVHFGEAIDVNSVPSTCEEIFQDSAKLGAEATCEFVDTQTMEITPTTQLTVNVSLTLKADVLKVYCGKYLQSQVAVLEPPVGASKPVAILSAPLSLSACQDLEMDASTSYAYSGTLKYSFTHVNDGVHEFSPEIATQLENLPTYTSFVRINANLILVGTSRFELKVTDIYGQTAIATIYVTKGTDSQIPLAFIEGPSHRTIYRRDPLFIEGYGRFSSCAQTTGLKLQFLWTSVPEVPLGNSRNTPTLFVEPYLLDVGVNYAFHLKVSVVDVQTEQEVSSASTSVTVSVAPSKPVAIIAGGSRTVSTVGTLVLDASDSFDLDYPTITNLKFQWSCCQVVGQTCNFNLCRDKFPDLESTSSAMYTKTATPQDPFPEEVFKFFVNVSTVDERFDQTMSEITFKPGPVPIVSIRELPSEIHNPSRPLILLGNVKTEASDVSYQWTLVEGSPLDLNDKEIAPYGTTQIVLYIAESKLTGTYYKFRLSASALGSTGYADISVTVNQPPSGGTLSASPQNVQSLQDIITLSTSGWTDAFDDLPLKYTFYQVVETPSGTVDIPINVLPQTRGEISFIAPAVDKDTVVTFKVTAFDNKNSGGNSALATVTVKAIQKQNDETFEDLAERLINEQLEILVSEGDFNRISRYVDSVAEVLRLSEGTDPDSVQRRVKLKNKLIDLYRFVTQENANFINGDLRKSIISTLSKLLGKSNEINEDLVSSTLEILRLTFDLSDSNRKHSLEAMPLEMGKQAIETVSNLIEAGGFSNNNYSEEIATAIEGIGLLSLVDKPIGSRVELKSSQIKFLQARELSNQILGRIISNEDSEITVSDGVFDNLDSEQKEKLSTVDIRFLLWNSNPHHKNTQSNITSAVISANLLDDHGNELKIKNLKKPILIKVPSKSSKSGAILCKYFNKETSQWEDIQVEAVKEGEYTICATTHLSDFATFIAEDTEEIPPPGHFNTNWLWLLMLLIPGVLVVVTITALGIVVYRKRRKSDPNDEMEKGEKEESKSGVAQEVEETAIEIQKEDEALPEISFEEVKL